MSYTDRATHWADVFGIDPGLYSSLVTKESAWNPGARNPSSGAFGLTQVMPATARDPGFGIDPLTDPSDPDDQLRFGAEYLSTMLDRYGGDVPRALAAYNWGPGKADSWSGRMSALPAETRDYIETILGRGGVATAEDVSGPRGTDFNPDASEEEEREYMDNWLGRAQRGLDERRDAMQERLGISDRGVNLAGDMLVQLGLGMMG